MRLSFSVPLLHSFRGAGLADEAIPWAKAFIGAREFGLRRLHPAWGLNPRGYSHDFSTSRLDAVAQRALVRALPTRRITPALVESTGERDYARALTSPTPRAQPSAGPARSRDPRVDGRRLDRHQIGARVSPRCVPPATTRCGRPLQIGRRLNPEKLTAAVHLRFGDFLRSGHGPGPGIFNQTLPDSWYEETIHTILDTFPDRLDIVLVTDDPDAAVVRRLLELDQVQVPPTRARPVLSDLSLLASADLLVCSTSAFSQLAAFLSESPYIWCAPHLYVDKDGWGSIWGHDEHHNGGAQDGTSTQEPRLGKGFPLGESVTLPPELEDLLERRLSIKRSGRDLIQGGVVRFE